MNIERQIKRVMAVIVFAGLFPVIVLMAIGNTGEFYTTQGIIEYVDDNTLIVNKKVHDITGVYVLDMNGKIIVKRENILTGKVAVIKHHEEKLVYVKILPQVQK